MLAVVVMAYEVIYKARAPDMGTGKLHRQVWIQNYLRSILWTLCRHALYRIAELVSEKHGK